MPAAAPRSGLPWEQRHTLGFVSAFTQTVAMVLTRPAEAFTVMRTEGGLADPLLFGVIGGSIGAIVWILVSAAIHSLGWAAALSQQSSLQNLMGASVSGMMLIVRVILTPILITLGLFIWAGLVHLFLMMAGGAGERSAGPRRETGRRETGRHGGRSSVRAGGPVAPTAQRNVPARPAVPCSVTSRRSWTRAPGFCSRATSPACTDSSPA